MVTVSTPFGGAPLWRVRQLSGPTVKADTELGLDPVVRAAKACQKSDTVCWEGSEVFALLHPGSSVVPGEKG